MKKSGLEREMSCSQLNEAGLKTLHTHTCEGSITGLYFTSCPADASVYGLISDQFNVTVD